MDKDSVFFGLDDSALVNDARAVLKQKIQDGDLSAIEWTLKNLDQKNEKADL